MDYGKIAYLKTEDIERRLNAISVIDKNQCSSFTVSPSFDLRQGIFDVTQVSANGAVTIIAKVVLRANMDVSEKFCLLVNGLVAGVSEVNFKQGEITEKIIMCSAFVTGNASLSVSCDANMILESVQVLCLGASVNLQKSNGSASLEKCGDTWVLVSCENDDVKVYFFSEENFVLTSPYFLGTGKSGDVTAWKSGYAFCYTDRSGNTFVRVVDKNMSGVFTQVVATNSESSAITSCDGCLIVAYCEKGKVYVVRVDGNGGKSQPLLVKSAIKCSSLSFVKNASKPTLILYDGQRSVMKNATTSEKRTDVISLALIIAFGS